MAEQSDSTLLYTLCTKAGELLAHASTQNLYTFYSTDADFHLKCAKASNAKSETQRSLGNVRATKIYATVAHYHKILAAIVFSNFDIWAYPVPALAFPTVGLFRVFSIFDDQLLRIGEVAADGKLWQAEVLLCDLETHVELLHPNAYIEDDIADLFISYSTISQAETAFSTDLLAYLNDGNERISASAILQVFKIGAHCLPRYVHLFQVCEAHRGCCSVSYIFVCLILLTYLRI